MVYNAAKLAESGVHPDLFAKLTDWQIVNIYGHDRDEQGRLIEPIVATVQPESYERDCAALLALCSQFSIPLEVREAKLKAIKAKWGVT